MTTLEQWVNLEKDSAYTNDGDGATLERCGHVTVQLRFRKGAVPIGYSVKIKPVGTDNIHYSLSEVSRHRNFLGNSQTRGVTINGLEYANIQLPIAGGNTYKIEAQDTHGNTVSTTSDVIVKRKLYYQVMSMDDGNGNATQSYPLTTMEAHASKHHIRLIRKGADRTIPYTKTIIVGKHDKSERFMEHIADAWNLARKHAKVGFAAVFCDYLANVESLLFSETIAFGVAPRNIKIFNDEILFKINRYLYHGLNDEDDKSKRWYVAGGILFTDRRTGTANTTLIPIENVQMYGSQAHKYGGYHIIRIRKDPSLHKAFAALKPGATIKINIRLLVVVGWINGFSSTYRGVPLITCVVVKSFWPRFYRHPNTASRRHWVPARHCGYAA